MLKSILGIPESSEEGCINGVSVVHIKVVPAAFSSKVVEPQSEYCVGPGKDTQGKTVRTSTSDIAEIKYQSLDSTMSSIHGYLPVRV